MKKSDFTGWQEVFVFSFLQSIKQKAFVGFLVVTGLILLLYTPISTLIRQSKDGKEEKTSVTAVTVYDGTGLGVDYTKALPGARYAETKVVQGAADGYEEHVKSLEESEDSREIVVRVTYEEGVFQLTFVKAANADLSDKDYKKTAEDFEAFFGEAKLEAVEVTAEQNEFLHQPVTSRIQFTKENGEITTKEENEGISTEEYFILFGGLMIAMMLISFSGSSIAVSIVTEKSTRVVEYLMIHIRPMALIVGKILAALAAVFVQLVVMGICSVLSRVISAVLFGVSEGSGVIDPDSFDLVGSLQGLDAGNIVLSVVIIMAGILFFSIVAGLAGASVSKIDELAEGLKMYQILTMSGYFVGIFLCILQMAGVVSSRVLSVLCIVPTAAPFILPGNLLLGKVGTGTALVSSILLIVLTGLLFSFTAKVYEAMIFYNGNPMKLKDILRIAKERQGSAGKGEKSR